jgi:C4-dicarboxylate-specific signal transduction histidine kinase
VGLQQVLMNLMFNGIEAMKDMGAPGKLTISSHQNGDDQFLVSVADMGIGLQPEHVEQIFSPFFTSKNLKGLVWGCRLAGRLSNRRVVLVADR